MGKNWIDQEPSMTSAEVYSRIAQIIILNKCEGKEIGRANFDPNASNTTKEGYVGIGIKNLMIAAYRDTGNRDITADEAWEHFHYICRIDISSKIKETKTEDEKLVEYELTKQQEDIISGLRKRGLELYSIGGTDVCKRKGIYCPISRGLSELDKGLKDIKLRPLYGKMVAFNKYKIIDGGGIKTIPTEIAYMEDCEKILELNDDVDDQSTNLE